MNKLTEQAIEEFYKYNKIDDKIYSLNGKDRLFGFILDRNIPREILETNLTHWLDNFGLDDQETFLALFSHFRYIPKNIFEYMVTCFVDRMKKELSEYDLKETLFVFVESPKGCKSGIDDFAVALWECLKGEIWKEQLITHFSMLNEKKILENRNIIFVDDIIATGFSMNENIKKFFEKFPQCKNSNIKYYVASLFLTRRGKKFIEKKRSNMTLMVEKGLLKSAFRGNYIFSSDELKKKEECVLPYEDKAGKEYDGKKYVMGFSESKLLIGFYYEIPNNTLSTFWRHTEDFTPLFSRSSEHAFSSKLTLKEIIEKKKKMANRAYVINSMGGYDESE